MMNIKSDFLKKLIFYVIIGVVGVIVDTIVSNIFFNFVFKPIFQDKTVEMISLEGTLAATIGGIAGFVNNFLLNEFFVYKKEGNKKVVAQRFSKFVVTVLFGTFFIGKFLVFNLFFSVLTLGFTTSNLIAIAVGTLINYPINYFWTWGEFSVKDKLKNAVSKQKN